MSEHDYKLMRQSMVSSQLRTTAVSDPRIVAVMQSVARENFVPADRKALAYVDVAVPLGNGRALNPPMVTGRLLNEAGISATDKVLLVGSATGYCAALIAKLAASVVALETDRGLAVSSVKSANVSHVCGDLAKGWPKSAPYDIIVIDGAVDSVPATLVDQLVDGGRMVAAVVDQGVTRLAVGTKIGHSLVLVPFADADAVILPGFNTPVAFKF